MTVDRLVVGLAMNAGFCGAEAVQSFFSSLLGLDREDETVRKLSELAQKALRDESAAAELTQWAKLQWPNIIQRLQAPSS